MNMRLSMAGETLTYSGSAARALSGNRIAETGYLGFLLLIFVGLIPFAVRDPVVLAAGESGFSASGDTVRQIAFLAAFLWIALAAWRKCGGDVLRSVPLLLAVLIVWCLVSASWASEPDVSIRRAVLASVIVLSAMLSVQAVGSERALQLLRYVLAAVLVVNWLSIFIVPQAVHLPGETDPGLVGDWRGLYFHKNIAGSVTAISAILFFFEMLKTRRLVDVVLFLAAVVFTAMTQSKSSIGLLPAALAAGLIYRYAWVRGIDRTIVAVSAALAIVVCAALVVTDWSGIERVLEDPNQFTGRAAIWQGELSFIADHPFLGAGFGTFADTGALSPLHNYVGDVWVQNVSHGHNAYLQLFVTIGGIGLLLSLAALVIAPLAGFLRECDPEQIRFLSVALSVFVFMVFHNLLESDFLEGDSPAWVAFLLILAIGRNTSHQRSVQRHGVIS
ncbi:MAG: O-antigen ligase family protein [Rhizomicrobium sp.]|jgi:O-antigen ligase